MDLKLLEKMIKEEKKLDKKYCKKNYFYMTIDEDRYFYGLRNKIEKLLAELGITKIDWLNGESYESVFLKYKEMTK